jgi:hypothetical protein
MHTKFFVGKPEGMRPLGRPKNRWEDSIWILKNQAVRQWIHFAQDRILWQVLQNTVMNLHDPQKNRAILSFSMKTLHHALS